MLWNATIPQNATWKIGRCHNWSAESLAPFGPRAAQGRVTHLHTGLKLSYDVTQEVLVQSLWTGTWGPLVYYWQLPNHWSRMKQNGLDNLGFVSYKWLSLLLSLCQTARPPPGPGGPGPTCHQFLTHQRQNTVVSARKETSLFDYPKVSDLK